MNQDLLERRGLILHACHAQYPGRLMFAAIERHVMPFYVNEGGQFTRDLEYLKDSAFLSEETAEVAGRSYTSYKITPAGINLVEGTRTDPGISFKRF